MFRYVIAAAVLLSLPAQAIEIFEPGDHYETYNIPNIWPCQTDGCTSFWFVAKHNQPQCVSYENIRVERPDGSLVGLKIEEVGQPGEAGYQLDVKTTEEVYGPITLHIRVVGRCPRVS